MQTQLGRHLRLPLNIGQVGHIVIGNTRVSGYKPSTTTHLLSVLLSQRAMAMGKTVFLFIYQGFIIMVHMIFTLRYDKQHSLLVPFVLQVTNNEFSNT